MVVDSLVESISVYRRRPIVSFVYVGPFAALYALWFYYWIAVVGLDEIWELGCIVTAGIVILQVALISHLTQEITSDFRHFAVFSAIGSLQLTAYLRVRRSMIRS
jgi:hypothetical protein